MNKKALFLTLVTLFVFGQSTLVFGQSTLVFGQSTSVKKDPSLLDELLNVASWIDKFSQTINNIVEKETLYSLSTELSYLSTDINGIIQTKRRILNKIKILPSSQKIANEGFYKELSELQQSLSSIESRFQNLSRLIPSQYKTTVNSITIDVFSLINTISLPLSSTLPNAS